jgi:hypothetical protein
MGDGRRGMGDGRRGMGDGRWETRDKMNSPVLLARGILCSVSVLPLLHLFTPSPLLLFTSSPLLPFSSSPLLLFTPSPLLLFSSSPLHLFSSSPLLPFVPSERGISHGCYSNILFRIIINIPGVAYVIMSLSMRDQPGK